MSDVKLPGAAADVTVSSASNGKVRVTAEMDSHADAMAAAEKLARERRKELTGIDKVLAFDNYLSPRVREAAVVFIRLLAVVFTIVLGLVIGLTSGHAAVFIFPDAPMPEWLLFTMGAITVPGGIWAADELVKVIRDDIPDSEQKSRKVYLIAVIAFCLAFDSIGVITTRVASTTGAMEEMKDAKNQKQILEQKLAAAANELFMYEPPIIPSSAYARKISAKLEEPTETGKPVQTVGELKARCDGQDYSYCHPYRKRFAEIDTLIGKMQEVEAAERRRPELEKEIDELQAQIDLIQISNVDAVDDFFARGETDLERQQSARDVRFWRTIFVSIGQVFILAIAVLILLDDRHANIRKRQQKALQKLQETI